MPNELELISQDESIEIAGMIEKMMSPIIEAMAKMVANNTEALERLATQQKIQSDRMEALEKQIRLNTPVTPVQVKYFNSCIRNKATDELSSWDGDNASPSRDKWRVNRLSTVIRRDVLTRYGVGALHEIPKCEYTVVISMIESWNKKLVVREIARMEKQ